MNKTFLDFFNSMTIAMEADDITNQIKEDAKDLDVNSTNSAPSNNDNTEDLEKVDDIFGLKEKKENSSNDNSQDNPSSDSDEDNSDTNDIQNDESGSENSDPNMDADNNSSDDDTQMDDSSIDLAFTSKNRVRDNLVQLYTIIGGNIEIIVSSLTDINDEKTIKVMNSVLDHLRNSKKYIYNTLTKELASLSYDELLQRYIAMKRVYDMCILMLEKHLNITKKK